MVPGYDQRQARTGLAGLTKPDPKDRASQIVAWAICWPWNLVWTICVYNPFRYVAEFLLKEIQSALFEISNGQFSSIEQDLTLDPPPPPYPIPTPQPRQSEATTTVSVEASNAAAQSAPEEPAAVENTAPEEQSVATSAPAPSVSIEIATADPVASVPQTNDETVQADTSAPISLPVAAEALPNESIEDSPEEVEAELAEGGSADSYTWAPPVPTAFVPLSNQPLRAVKYETGSAVPAKPDEPTPPPKPASDPWLEKHVPNQ
jgi:hypothetical protein